MSFKEQLEQIKKKCEFDEKKILKESRGRYSSLEELLAFQHSQLKPVIASLLEIIEIQKEALDFYRDMNPFPDDGRKSRQTQAKVLEKLEELDRIYFKFNLDL